LPYEAGKNKARLRERFGGHRLSPGRRKMVEEKGIEELGSPRNCSILMVFLFQAPR
jgi:hypothetical protein